METHTPFDTILIANRGEIACRIMRTAKSMGLNTIAVYADADADALHVKLADQAVHIGPSPPTESYLVIEKIINAAKQTGAQAIHPGYGFLSENAEFAKACHKAGLVFIGPNPDALELMGDKAKAKRRMIKAGVPSVPGYHGKNQDDVTLLKESETIGFPIMVKAAAGGGGRGMRFVDNPKQLPDAIKDARSEAANAFGSDTLILERAVIQPRHVEIQVFADKYGNTVHLGERDCSVQRRHQKVLEEAPCPVMTAKLRIAMGEAAVKAAKDIGYVGAGTVEFMLDSSGDFFFLEMNTRLQVEHPVTEMITGLDLVALQIRVARGEELGLTQKDVTLTGHAIEARLYAEDPANDFLPATGPVDLFEAFSGHGIRIDSGIETGDQISPFYDPMIAKIIAYGRTRDEARIKLISALENTALFGLKTNRGFLIDALAHPVFASGNATTAFIRDNTTSDTLNASRLSPKAATIAALIQYLLGRDIALQSSLPIALELMNWMSATKISTPFAYQDGEDIILSVVTPQGENTYHVNNQVVTVLERNNISIHLDIEGERVKALFYANAPSELELSIGSHTFKIINQNAITGSAEETAGAGTIIAPMHGALLEQFVKTGDTVTKGQRLAIVEAMKMQHEILADIDGTIISVHSKSGDQIAADALLFFIEAKA